MKVILEKLVNSQEGLNWLSGEKRLEAVDKFALAFLLGSVNEHLQQYDKTRIETLEKYGEKNGDRYDIPDENRERFNSELRALLATECDVPDTVIPVEPLMDDLTAARILQLGWLLEKKPPAPQED